MLTESTILIVLGAVSIYALMPRWIELSIITHWSGACQLEDCHPGVTVSDGSADATDLAVSLRPEAQ